ncbi:cytochrome P450 3A29 [Ixodes scapularis]
MVGFLLKILLAAAAVLLTCVIWWIRDRRRKHTFFRNLGVPGPKPTLLWGNRKQLSEDTIKVMGQWIKTYGKVFGMYRSESPVLVISDAEMIKQCFVKEFDAFHDKPGPPVLVEPFKDSLPFLKGDEWKKMRTLLNPAFSTAKMRLMMQTINKCADVFVDILTESSQKGEVLEMYKVAQGLSLDVITKCALAWQVDCQRNPDDPLLKELQNIFRNTSNVGARISFWFPALKHVIEILHKKWQFMVTQENIIANLRNVISLRRRGQAPSVPDLLQLMLNCQSDASNAKDHTDQKNLLLEDRMLIANCFIFILGGLETTSLALAYTLFLLAKHPEEQDRLFQELTDMFPGNQELSSDDLRKLKRLDIVFKESLRLYPPTVAFVSRTCRRDITVMGQFIPSGTSVTVPVWHLHHDADYWPDPFKFDPERFSEGQERHPPEAYAPFGLGPRACIGSRLAMLELKATLVKVVRRFKILLCDETQDPPKIRIPLSLTLPENGIRLKLDRRDP